MTRDLSRRLQILTGTLFAVCSGTPALAHTPIRYDGDAIVRFDGDFSAHQSQLQAWGIESWSDHPDPFAPLLHVPASARAQLDISGLPYEVLEPDLQAALDRASARPTKLPGAREDFFADFRPLAEIEAQLTAWAQDVPKRVAPVTVGTSLQGREIRAIRIGTHDRDREDVPIILVNATQHAREWIATSSAMYVADALIHSEDETIAALRQEVTFVVVPVANPDGYVFTWEEDRLWRKNRRDDVGVDLNRNWPVAWGGEGSSDDPTSNNYRGAAPLSEPEAAALAELADGLHPLVAHVDVHAYGQLVLSPWSFGLDEPPDGLELTGLGEAMATAMSEVAGSEYTPIPAAELYPAAGTLPDYTYGTLGARGFTFELRPMGAEPHDVGFVPGPAEIVPTGQEALAGILTLAEAVAEARPLPPGDDGGVVVEPDTTGGSGTGDGAGSTTSGGATSGEPPSGDGSSEDGTGVGDRDGTSDAAAAGADAGGGACACSTRGGSPQGGWWAWAIFGGALGRARSRRARARARAWARS